MEARACCCREDDGEASKAEQVIDRTAIEEIGQRMIAFVWQRAKRSRISRQDGDLLLDPDLLLTNASPSRDSGGCTACLLEQK